MRIILPLCLWKEENPEAMLWAKKLMRWERQRLQALLLIFIRPGSVLKWTKRLLFQWELKGAEAGDEYAQDGIARRYRKVMDVR